MFGESYKKKHSNSRAIIVESQKPANIVQKIPFRDMIFVVNNDHLSPLTGYFRHRLQYRRAPKNRAVSAIIPY